MHYFITSRQDYQTSAIELAQVKRAEIFDKLKQENKIIELEYNYFFESAHNKLKNADKVINMYHFFQKLPYKKASADQATAAQLLDKNKYQIDGDTAYDNGKKVAHLVYSGERIYYVDYYDQYGFTIKRDFYDCGILSHTEFFDDNAQLILRQYYDENHQIILSEYYRKAGDQKIISAVELLYQGQLYRFDNRDGLRGFFLDEIVKKDPQAVLYCDRTTSIVPAFEKMKLSVPRYVIFHSALTPSGNPNDELYDVYKPITNLVAEGRINGLISSTKAEARDAARIYQTTHSYAIPVTYISEIKPVSYLSRKFGNIIAVARVAAIKQLDQLITAIIKLHQKYDFVELSIYGNTTDAVTSQKLHQLVKEQNAEDFIHFNGYAQNLDQVYNEAQMEVLTSSSEGFAMAVLEAQAHGVPVVSYDINYGPCEIIDDGKSGQLIEPNNVKQLEYVLDQLLSKPEKLAVLSEGAYQAAQKYSFENVTEKWRDFLTQEKILDN